MTQALSADQIAARVRQLRELQARIDDELTRLAAMNPKPPTRHRRSRYEPAPCGTEAGYQAHKYRGETCDLCRAAHAAHERARTKERSTAT